MRIAKRRENSADMPGNAKRINNEHHADTAPADVEAVSEKSAPKIRIVSVDALRGLTIFGMLLVNNVALDEATPRLLTHAGWNRGIYFADMIFPWFLFVSGVSIPYSAATKDNHKLRHELRILRRTIALILLGFAVDSSVASRLMVGLGVLQLIGLSYFFAAVLYDLPLVRRMYIAIGLLVSHWAAIRFIPFPGALPGTFTETHNLIRHFNDVYLQPIGLRGLISVAPASALAIIGSIIGDLLHRNERKHFNKGLILIAAGMGMTAAGWLWNLDLPFNKSVWTASYVLFSGGTATILLSLFFLTFDVWGIKALAYPLVVFGSNALLAYILPIFLKTQLLNRWIVTCIPGKCIAARDELYHFYFTHFGRIPGGWLYTLSFIFFWWLVMWMLYRKRIFLRV